MRDIFIIGQKNRALHRHLDSVGPDTPITEIVDRCRVWESHKDIHSGRVANHEPNRPHAVLQVTNSVNNEHVRKTSTGLDVVENLIKRLLPSLVESIRETGPVPSDYELLTQRLCDMTQPLVPEDSDMIDKAFIDVDASVRLQLVRDRFIIGQENRALHWHLDSVGPDTPITEIVDRCCVWESHKEIHSGRVVNYEPNRPHAVLQVTNSVNNEHDKTSTGLDVVENLIKRLLPSPVESTQETGPVPSDYELLAQRLCEMTQPSVPEDSDMIDIEQLLRKLIPLGPVVEEAVRPTPEFQEVDDRESGNVA